MKSRAAVWLAFAGVLACGGHEARSAEEHGGHDHDHDHGHGHGHGGGEAIGITRFTDKVELFAEHPSAVAGEEMPFLAHLTVLDGFAPVRDATVTLSLDGPAHVEAEVQKPLRPGIFQPVLKAPKAGTYQGSLRIRGPQVEDTVKGFDIVVYPSADAAAQATSPSEPGGGERITFLKEQQWQVPFATAFVRRGELVPHIEVAGEVTTPPSGQAEISAAITGRIVAPPKGLPRPGQTVKRGQLLATIAPAPAAPEAAARADLAVVEAEARLQAAQAAAERADRLIADHAIAQRQVDDAHRELRVAESSLESARRARAVFARAESGRGEGLYRVTAPIDGTVVNVETSQGKSVGPGEHLLRLVNLQELWVRARVPEQDAAKIRSDQDAAYKLPGVDTWWPLDVTGDDASATVVHVGRTVDPRSRTVDVIYGLDRPDPRLRVGSMARVAVPAGEPWQGVIVPRDALLEDDGRFVVYVQVEGESFEERPVRLGARAGAWVGLSEGVQDGERIVTQGANVIRLASRASAAPAHGHVH